MARRPGRRTVAGVVGRWVVHGERVVYDSSWVSVALADVETPDGRRVPEHHVVRAPLQAAGCVVHDPGADAVLLIWRHRFITDTWGYEVPAGRAEPGEAMADAAAREVLEETGWRPLVPLSLLARWHPSNGLIDQTFSAFLATGAVHEGEPSDPSEAARVEWLPVAEVERLVDAGEIRDGLSLTALLAWLRGRTGRGGEVGGGGEAGAQTLLGLLAEPDRLRVVAALAPGARSTAEVVAGSGLGQREAVAALNRLRRGGLVGVVDHAWELQAHRLKEVARAAAERVPPEPVPEGVGEREAAVLRAFLREGRLTSIPVARAKRRIVLDHLSRLFEVGRRYPEREVDAALRAVHPDHAALRRHLVDEGFLDRADGAYWRSGGTVPL